MRLRFPARIIAAALLALFAAANFKSYQGYFSDDDLDNLSWTSYVDAGEFARGLLDWKLSPHNFRPVGHFYFFAMGRLADDQYLLYVAVLQLIHVANAGLLYWLLRRLGFAAAPAAGAMALWAFHFALFDAVWKPMYIFDVLCGTFCLLVWHAWLSREWVLAAALFWLAYKSKEVALFLPAGLAIYEFTAGQRRWKQLIPMLAISASFGLQALLAPKGPVTDYSLRFTAEALARCAPYYAKNAGGLLLAALVLPGLADRRARWSLAAAIALQTPLLFLPGRLFAVYLYVPLAFAMPLAAAWFERFRYWPLLLLGWGFWDDRRLRERRREYLPVAAIARSYYSQLGQAAARFARLGTLYYDSVPAGTNAWGVEGMVHWRSRNPEMKVQYTDPAPPLEPGTAVAQWDDAKRLLTVRFGGDPL
jgi:hypothetical protein